VIVKIFPTHKDLEQCQRKKYIIELSLITHLFRLVSLRTAIAMFVETSVFEEGSFAVYRPPQLPHSQSIFFKHIIC
jgi:hypothetical protein